VWQKEQSELSWDQKIAKVGKQEKDMYDMEGTEDPRGFLAMTKTPENESTQIN
jgi:hypothetical protein